MKEYASGFIMNELAVIIDTNIFISALIGKTKSNPRVIIDAFKKGEFTLIISPTLLRELEEVVKEPGVSKVVNPSDAFNLITLIEIKAKIVTPTQKIKLCRDPKDNIVLETAFACHPKPAYILSGDKDLLVLKKFLNIPIITPVKFLKLLPE